MSVVVLVVRVVLALIFATAGVAKLGDLQASANTVEAFGIPQRIARYGGSALPCAEIATAVALLITAVARWGAVAALLLLLTFSAGVTYALSQGRTPDCNCFGQVSSAQISWRTLARNFALALVAGFVVWKAPGSSLASWTGNLTAANLTAGLGLVALALTGVFAWRYRQLSAAAAARGAPAPKPGLPIGSPAPAFELPDLDGNAVSLASLLERDLPLVLVFASPMCMPCNMLMPEIARWTAALDDAITLVVVENDVADRDALAARMRSLGTIRVLTDPGHEVADSYSSRVTPTGVAIASDGRIASTPTPGGSDIEALVRRTLRNAAETPLAGVTR